MSRSLRASRVALLPLAVLSFGWSACRAPAPGPGSAAAAAPAPAAAPGIEWQRSLADALAVAAAEHRPLLIAVNMDGESASDRIWREEYRDPAFVAAANRCVCVAASLFRHNPHDHDEQGRRVECPRLPGLTCGEHVALEPQLFEKFLADGERVAPRHALVKTDGTKVFDLSLCFDLKDIDRALQAAVADLPPRPVVDFAAMGWEELAARRDHAGRGALEARLAGADEAGTLAGLAAIGKAGDAGAWEALAAVKDLNGFFSSMAAPVRAALVDAARACGAAPALAQHLREAGSGLAQLPVSLDLQEQGTRAREQTQDLLAGLDGQGAATRTFLLASMCDWGQPAAARRSVLARLVPGERVEAVAAAFAHLGDLLGGEAALQRPRSTPSAELSAPVDAMPESAELDRTLEALEKTPAAERRADWNARFAKASLDLARRHLEEQKRDVQILLDDAEMHWKRALAAEAAHPEWWIERARTAYFLGHFTEQVEFGERAAVTAQAAHPQLRPGDDPLVVEALRWVGDAYARQLGNGGELPVETTARAIGGAFTALEVVAHGGCATAKDWLSFASFLELVGLRDSSEVEALRGLQTFSADRDLWMQLFRVASSPQGAAREADLVVQGARLPPGRDLATALWWAGYAHTNVAEHYRRLDLDVAALHAYERARARFAEAMAKNSEFTADCTQHLAAIHLGRGHALVFSDRPRAARELVAAVRTIPQLAEQLAQQRDGLGYDVLDLVDKLLEWRATGPTDVDSAALLTELLAAAPQTPFYGLAIADAELREALRADGRNPERAMRDTVDAAGKPIRMPMGLATDEGDAYLQRSLAAARRVAALVATPEDHQVLAQSATIAAERDLERHRLAAVPGYLAEAAQALGLTPPPAGADVAALTAFAAQLRKRLGEARPRQRDGR